MVSRLHRAHEACPITSLRVPKGCGVLVRPGSLAQFTHTSSLRIERAVDASLVTVAQVCDVATGGGAIDVGATRTIGGGAEGIDV